MGERLCFIWTGQASSELSEEDLILQKMCTGIIRQIRIAYGPEFLVATCIHDGRAILPCTYYCNVLQRGEHTWVPLLHCQ